jgi:hypothetical protein
LVGIAAGVLLSLKREREVAERMDAIYSQDVGAARPPPRTARREDFMQPDPLALQGIPPYPGARPRRLSSSTAVQGEPMASAWFSTEDSVDTVLEFYASAFRPLRAIQVSHRYHPNAGYVGFYEEPEADSGVEFLSGRVHLVSVVRSGSQTHVFLSNTKPESFLNAVAPHIADIPLPDNVKRPRVLNVGELEQRRQVLFTSTFASMDSVQQHFNSTLPGFKWQVGEWRRQEDGTMSSELRKPGKNATLSLSSDGATTRILVSVDDIPPAVPPESK